MQPDPWIAAQREEMTIFQLPTAELSAGRKHSSVWTLPDASFTDAATLWLRRPGPARLDEDPMTR